MESIGITEWLLIIAAIGVVINSAITTWRTNQKISQVSETVKVVEKTAEKIEGHVNSAASASAAREQAYINEIKSMRTEMADKKQIAALLAQSAGRTIPIAEENIKSTTEHLGKIEENTKAIEINTARTDKTVTDLKDKS